MTMGKQASPDRPATGADRLESWKEIATYLKRGVRTVRRWEKEEGLPIHRQRHKTLGTVYAITSELEAWRASRSGAPAAPDSAPAEPAHTSSRLMIAVLPFANLSVASAPDFIAEGMTDEVISQLGRFNPRHLGVIARTTMMQYQQRKRTVRQVGAELHVDYIVEGSVRREGDHVRVTAQLVRVADQSHVWSGAYDETTGSLLALQRALAAAIAHEIRETLSPANHRRVSAAADVRPEAYLAYLQGRHLLNEFTPQSVRASVQWFIRATEADPTYASAYASLAEVYQHIPMWLDAAPTATLPLALDAAERALELDPSLPDAYSALGLIHANYMWNWAKAERLFQRALELNPGCLPARQWYAEFLAEMGRIDEALDMIDRSQQYDPLSVAIPATRAFALSFGRRFDEAIAESRRALQLNTDYPMALIRLGVAYAGKQMYSPAIDAFRQAAVRAPDLLDCLSLLGYAEAANGDRSAARRQLEMFHRMRENRYVPAFLLANIHVGLGEYDEAVQLIEKEYEARGWYLLLLNASPLLDPLRSHDGFRALVRQMNFPLAGRPTAGRLTSPTRHNP